ncbi:hypothetical protein [Gluconobacter japonicus]|uniref:hypothetical protein n=1 Tax=Gluconobacter japonicus TaxID=376620 RepID=UPI001B8D99B6|nr:hypothetical protein [Gluconobacter japonicus]MBS1049932.1 hypothetical protein [Gluconobacter japonicus]
MQFRLKTEQYSWDADFSKPRLCSCPIGGGGQNYQENWQHYGLCISWYQRSRKNKIHALEALMQFERSIFIKLDRMIGVLFFPHHYEHIRCVFSEKSERMHVL